MVDRATHAKLEVSFFRPFWGDYWIIDLGADQDRRAPGGAGLRGGAIGAHRPTLVLAPMPVT
jgi:hypothetical protein